MAAAQFAVSSLSCDELVSSLLFFSGVDGPHHSCSYPVGIGVRYCTLSRAPAPAARQGGKGHLSSWERLYPNAFIFNNILRLLPWGAVRCLYSECRGTGQLPEYSQMVKTKRWLHELVWYTKEANRIIPKENNTECSQPAAAWPTAAVLWGSEGWGLEVVSERKRERGYISFLLPTVAPRS